MDARALQRISHVIAALSAAGATVSCGLAVAQEKGPALPPQIKIDVTLRSIPVDVRTNIQELPLRGAIPQRGMQLRSQLLPVLYAELALIRSTCPMTTAQRAEVRKAGGRALDEAVKAITEHDAEGVRFIDGQWEPPPDARKIIVGELTNAVQTILPGEAATRYREELEQRTADERRTTIRVYLARLDRELVLSPKQRDRLADALAAHWDEELWSSLGSVENDERALPMIPDPVILPLLDEPQKNAWRSAQKSRWAPVVGWNGLGFLPAEDPLADEPAAPSRTR